MNRLPKKLIAFLLTAAVATAAFAGCTADADSSNSTVPSTADETVIVLNDKKTTVDGIQAETDSSDAVYLSDDVIYYEDRDTYESGNVYGEGSDADKHTADEAAATTVVNITKAGRYRISGSMSQGQIRVDLGEDAFENPDAVVTLVLDGVDISCDVAPALLFLNVYECDNQWSAETAQSVVDTSTAGANLVIADGSTNNIHGSYVAKIFKDNEEEKKLWKQDGAIYSYMSMNVDGEEDDTGVLNLNAENEGLDTELHLTINGGNINIFADNDGINTNEDGVSVTTINGGNVHIIAGLGDEGDGVDSNGWLVINGGTVVASANPAADAGLDSDMGSYINGGTVVALGSTMDWAESDSQQVTMNLQFAQYRESDSAIIVADTEGNTVFAYDPSEDEVVGSNTRRYMGAILSCSEFSLDESYNVYIGGTISGSETAGVYDIATVTGFDGAAQQAYSGTDVMMRPGGMGHFGGVNDFRDNIGKFDPENMPDGFKPPDGFGDNMEDFDPSKLPEGFDPENMPEGMEPPEGFDKEKPDRQWATDENGNPIGFGGEGEKDFADGTIPAGDRTVFFMQDKVNNFSGVADYTI